MKKNNTKRNFDKFTKRSVHKRRGKEKIKNELEKIAKESGVRTDGARFRSADFKEPLKTTFYGEARGIFSATKSAYAFVKLEDGTDVFIPAGKGARAIDGDYVEIEYTKYKNRYGEEKTDGRVTGIIEYGRKTVIGTLSEELVLFGRRRRGYIMQLIPDDARLSLRPTVDFIGDAKVGDKVEAKLIRAPYGVSCEVIRTFGDAESFGANYNAHLAEHGIGVDFSPEALSEAERVAREPIRLDGRTDLRRQVIFTIDGEGAKDLDDAVSVRKMAGGAWQLGVHIADVAHYVREKTALDRAVMARATSVYFTDKVVPMLPRALSNGACSLNFGEDKYAISAIINISPLGEILSLKLLPTVIKSRVRGVYSEVNALFDGTAQGSVKAKYRAVYPTLEKMRALYEILKKRSTLRGALELEIPEATVELDGRGEPVSIIKRERGTAEMMIEQFMLAANEAVATYLFEKGIPAVYRVHEAPPKEKAAELLSYAKNLGLDITGMKAEGLTTFDLARLLSGALERGVLAPVSYTALRAMSKARYAAEKQGHFGLGIASYCHFTSPIRRLSDLAVHRIIHRAVFEGAKPERYSSYARRAAIAATEGELRAVGAERDIENMYKALYMSRFLGESFSGVINSVTSFGLFVELPNTCEGLVPISELDGAFTFDEKTLTLRSHAVTYHLADAVTVRLEEVDVMRGKMRFGIIEKKK